MVVRLKYATTVSCLCASLFLYTSCGESDSSETGESTSSATTTESITNQIVSSLGGSEDAASSIKALPNLSSFLGSSSASLVATSAPNFVDIDTPEEVQTYLSGDIAALLTKVGTKVSSGDFTGDEGVEKLIKNFRQAALKCEMMESTVHNLSMLRNQTTSACYISQISDSNAGVLTYQSGDEYASDEEVLLPNADGSAKVVRLEMPDDADQEDIVITISAADKVLKYQLDFCAADGTGLGRDTVTFNHKEGDRPVLEMTSMHSGEEKNGDDTYNFAFHAVLKAPIKKDSSTGKYSFVEDAARHFNGIGYEKYAGTDSSFEDKFRSQIEVTSSEILLRQRASGYEQWSENSNTVRVDHAERSMFGVQYSGSSIADTKFTAGAGRRFWVTKSTIGSEVDSDKGVDRTAFEYNESASPRYETKVGVAKDILKKLAAVNHKTDDTLKEKPKKPSFDFSDNSCGATADSTYLLDLTSSSFATIAAECENELDVEAEGESANLCFHIERAQDDILDHLASMEASCSDCSVDSADESGAEQLDDSELE
ncbi:MAG: hypothetical protein OXT67_01700 [Zetaproteobacteria bacterium]|nr:hypothetical protein [Zetaproteobacteria bacterium]